jgi:hypothetical protein
MSSSAFPKILHLGEKAIQSLWDDEVEITEKVDGSQFGFGIVNGELIVRSKGKVQDLDNPDKMFRLGVEYVKSIREQLTEGAFYYGEYLEKPKHNVLAYDRVPRNNIALFGVKMDGEFRPYEFIAHEAERLHVEVVPLIFKGKSSPEHVLELVKGQSFLGGQEREGVVVKAYKPWEYMRFYFTVMAGKYVTEEFKEVHKGWKKEHTGKGKFESMCEQFATIPRYRKAVQHLRENGELEGSPRDIGKLIREVKEDITAEEQENIKNKLWAIFGEDVLRAAARGLPEWYKEELLKGEIDGSGRAPVPDGEQA